MAQRQLPNLFEAFSHPHVARVPDMPRSETDLSIPAPEQGHGKAFAVARRYRFLFMA